MRSLNALNTHGSKKKLGSPSRAHTTARHTRGCSRKKRGFSAASSYSTTFIARICPAGLSSPKSTAFKKSRSNAAQHIPLPFICSSLKLLTFCSWKFNTRMYDSSSTFNFSFVFSSFFFCN